LKKIFALILALVMALSLAACGGDKDNPVAGGNTDSANNTTETPNNPASDPTDDPQDTTDSTTPSATEPPATTIPATEPPATNPPATTPTHTHSYSSQVTAPTCTVGGYTTFTCACGHTYIANQTAAKGHSYSQQVVAPTCSAQGYTAYTCTCGHSYNANYTNPTNHTYSQTVTAATCTAQGYTTYTCSCGHSYVSDYVTPSHSYSNYVCNKCGDVDKSHAYDYLVLYIKQNGTTHGTQTIIKEESQGTTIELLYDAQVDAASLMLYFTSNDQFFFSQMYLDNYYYYTTFDDCKVTGYLDAKNFNENSALSYSNYEGAISNKQDIIDLARFSCCDMIDWLSWYLPAKNIGITIADLGFTSY